MSLLEDALKRQEQLSRNRTIDGSVRDARTRLDESSAASAKVMAVLIPLAILAGFIFLAGALRSGRPHTPATEIAMADLPLADDGTLRHETIATTNTLEAADTGLTTDSPPTAPEIPAAVEIPTVAIVNTQLAADSTMSAAEETPDKTEKKWPTVTVMGIAAGRRRLVMLDKDEMLLAGQKSRSGIRVENIESEYVDLSWRGETNRLTIGQSTGEGTHD